MPETSDNENISGIEINLAKMAGGNKIPETSSTHRAASTEGRSRCTRERTRTSGLASDIYDMAVAIAKYQAPQYNVSKTEAVAGAIKFLYDALVKEGKISGS